MFLAPTDANEISNIWGNWKWNITVNLMTFHPNSSSWLILLSLNGLLNFLIDVQVLMKVFSQILSKLLVSFQFPKFEIHNPHHTTDLILFSLHCPKCLKNFYIKESNPAMSNPQAACDPVEGFLWPSLDFRYSKSIVHTDNLSLFW